MSERLFFFENCENDKKYIHMCLQMYTGHNAVVIRFNQDQNRKKRKQSNAAFPDYINIIPRNFINFKTWIFDNALRRITLHFLCGSKLSLLSSGILGQAFNMQTAKYGIRCAEFRD